MMHCVPIVGRLAFVATVFVATIPAQQCAPQWRPGGGIPGVDGMVLTTTWWDPDGPGPRPARFVVAGEFAHAGDVAAANIAAFDPQSGRWSALGAGVSSSVHALATLPTGELVVGGQFVHAGGMQVNSIATWNGKAWHSLGGGLDANPLPFYFGPVVHALASLPNGDLIVGGSFDAAGGVAAPCIARWDGSAWHPLGAGITQQAVRALLPLPNGDVVVAGDFQVAGGVGASSIARWDGSTWHAIGGGSPVVIDVLAALPNGDIVAAGAFSAIGGVAASGVAAWDGSQWRALGSGPGFAPRALAVSSAELLAGGNQAVARWDGFAWHTVIAGTPGSITSFRALCPSAGGGLFVAGRFATLAGVAVENVAFTDGSDWSSLGEGTNGVINAGVALPDGGCVVGGTFGTIDGCQASHIAMRRDNGAWTPLGSGTDGPVSALVVLANGDVVAGGDFATAGSVSARHLARFGADQQWHPMGSGLANGGGSVAVHAMLCRANGDLIVGGVFATAGGVPAACLARWDGTAWSSLGVVPVVSVTALAETPDGVLWIAGRFGIAGLPVAHRVARWSDGQWQLVGPAFAGTIHALTARPGGTVVAAGTFADVGGAAAAGVAQWDGASWLPLGAGVDGPVRALLTLPDGDVLVAGTFANAGGMPAANIARFDGTAWSPVDGGLRGGVVRSLCRLLHDDVLAVGGFAEAGAFASARHAQLAAMCPAAVEPWGSGCGATLAAVNLPWADGTFHGVGSDLPAPSLVFAITGTQPIAPALPLDQVFAEGVPGCTVDVLPELLEGLVTLTGAVRSTLLLPDDPPLVGVPLWHQLVAIELDANGQWVGVTSSHSLRLVVGKF